MKFIKDLFSKQAADVVDQIGTVVDAVVTTDDEKLARKAELTKIVSDALNTAASFQKDVLLVELQGSWLQRNWRPLLMLTFGFIIFYAYFLSPVFHLNQVIMDNRFWDILELGIGGYVIGRSVEKVAKTVTENVDVSLVKKKNRKLNQAEGSD